MQEDTNHMDKNQEFTECPRQRYPEDRKWACKDVPKKDKTPKK